MFWTPIVLTTFWVYVISTSTLKGQKRAVRDGFIAGYVKWLSQSLGLKAEKSAWARILKYLGGGRLATMAKDVKKVSPFVLAGLFGGFIGYEFNKIVFQTVEDKGLLSEGATQNYVDQHTDFTTAWDNVYSPSAINENLNIIGNTYVNMAAPYLALTDKGSLALQLNTIRPRGKLALSKPAPIIGPAYIQKELPMMRGTSRSRGPMFQARGY